MAYITDIYTCVNVNLDRYDDLKNIERACGVYGHTDKYFELDKDVFQEQNISIPDIIGDELYKVIDRMFDNRKIDYVRFYYEY